MKLIPGQLYKLQMGDTFYSEFASSLSLAGLLETKGTFFGSGTIVMFLEEQKGHSNKEYFFLWFLTPDGRRMVTWNSSDGMKQLNLWLKEAGAS